MGTIEHQRALIAQALQSGAVRHSTMRTEWDIAGNCMSPVPTELHARPSAGRETFTDAVVRTFGGWEKVGDGVTLPPRQFNRKRIEVGPGKECPLTLLLWTRCRECEKCRKARATLWARRAAHEIACSARSWFGTLTARPSEAYRYLAQARQRLAAQGIDFDDLSVDEQFKLRAGEMLSDATLFCKRIRKNSNAPLRYLVVAEPHKSGVPHLHVLIHEVDPEQPVRHDTLSKAWRAGFSRFKLIGEGSPVGYVSKYLSKNASARVRASFAYGGAEPPLGDSSLADESERDKKKKVPQVVADPKGCRSETVKEEAQTEVLTSEHLPQ